MAAAGLGMGRQVPQTLGCFPVGVHQISELSDLKEKVSGVNKATTTLKQQPGRPEADVLLLNNGSFTLLAKGCCTGL